jgi:hypothetical protein
VPSGCATIIENSGIEMLGNRNIRLFWNEIPYATSYNIKLDQCCGGSGTTTYTGITQSPTVITAPFANASYYVSIQPICSYGTGTYAQTFGPIIGVQKTKSPTHISNPHIIYIEAESKLSRVQVYPIPANDEVSIDFEGDQSGKVRLSVFDVSGKELLNDEVIGMVGRNRTVVSVAGFTNGIYFLKVRQRNNEVAIKFVINR